MSRRGGAKSDRASSRKGVTIASKAELIILLASGAGPLDGNIVRGLVDDVALGEMRAQGIVCRERTPGEAYSLCEGTEAFKRAFAVCDMCGRSAALLETRYGEEAIEGFLDVAAKGLVLLSIFSLLKLLSSDSHEAWEDPSLLDLGEILSETEDNASRIDSVSQSLDAVGFRALLEFGLSGIRPEERGAAKEDHLRGMAQKDVDMFFAKEPPIPALGMAFVLLLFPEEERGELLAVLRSSPSAVRAMLTAQEARPGSLVPSALVQILPLLEHLFHLFVVSDPRQCDARRREALGREVTDLVKEALERMQRPSPLLTALRRRMLVDARERAPH